MITFKVLAIANHYAKWACLLTWKAQMRDQLFLNEIMGASPINEDDHPVVGDSPH